MVCDDKYIVIMSVTNKSSSFNQLALATNVSKNHGSTVHLINTFISRLLKNDMYGTYVTTLANQTESHKVTVIPLTNKHVAIYDKELLKRLCDARKIIFHKAASFVFQGRETHSIVILFEKYEKILPGAWLITNKLEVYSYGSFLKYIKADFPSFNPEEAVVDYDDDMQHGLRSAFPGIRFVPSFLHQMQEIVDKAIQTNAAVQANRISNAEKHSVLKKFIALSLLPKENIHGCFANLVKECKSNFGSYFDLFIRYYNEEWMEKWKPEVFCVYQLKDLMKTFLELYGCLKVFGTSTEYEPLILLDKIKTTSNEVRISLVSLEHGNIIPYYLSCEDEEIEQKLYRTWNRLSNHSITAKECLTICSNLLNDSFIDSLTDLTNRKTVNNNINIARLQDVDIHDMTTEILR